MSRDGQHFRRTLGEILGALVKQKYAKHTDKELGRRYDIDPATAKNLRRGQVSNRSASAVLWGEGNDVFELLDAIGHALTGMTRHEWEEQKLQRIIEEANRAKAQIASLRARRALMAESPPDLDSSGVLDRAPEHDASDSGLRRQAR